ncbi:AAA family ATPase [Natronoarchaeum sp. GCM10025703]|uniref:AAA family ATPase n=1 Tax=Natronoarchaeum sp. GCM10025703 TaxID=3252685 RepID=UPI00360AB660
MLQAYLCHLTPEAGAYLLDAAAIEPPEPEGETQYFWVNAEATDWHQEGGESFYQVTNSAGETRRNLEAYQEAMPGDQVLIYQIAPVKEVVGRAHVVRGLHEEASTSGYSEPVEGITLQWEESLDGASWRDVKSDAELDGSRLVESDNSFVITQLTEGEYERILELCEMTRFDDFASELSVPDSEIAVEQEHLHFPEEEWDRIQSRVEQALANGNHVLLFGPPGTGKTKLARQVCEATVGEDTYELVTASADWSTFDTVGGYQTTTQNTLEFEPGVVLDRFQADGDGTPANEWLVIDELNRADIDKAFGSLFSALTGESVTLPFDDADGDPIEILDASRSHEEIGQNRFFIPEDWRMLATMNTLDKTSLYEMSYAFMRRWAFVPVGIPDLPAREDGDDSALESLVADYVAVWAANGGVPEADQHYETVGRIWRAVNEQRAIGPAIVEDIYEHVAAASSTDTADYVSPIIMYVFPQLEGLRRNELEQLIGALDEIVDDETGELWTVARDFFQIDLQPGGGE